MCGIAGILNLKGERADPSLLHRMIGMVRYRGPDAVGFYTEGPIGLAHARLSIIDLAGGAQPMPNEDKTLWITFNGEIFNYLELREELEGKGHRFATQSDTEVILHMYKEKGEDCVNDFNGQWAFALWDGRRQKLFFSRDRMGVRPLFYTVHNQSLIFGSEIKSIFAFPGTLREIDLEGLNQIFTCWTTLPPKTIFKGVQEVPPGHSMVVEKGKVTLKPYWKPKYPSFIDNRSEQDYSDQLHALLLDASRIRLRADVPVGAYLSGGLDSTVITTLVKQFNRAPLKTFSVTFDDPEFDESRYQKEVSQFLGTDHETVHCAYEDIGRIFPEVIWHAEKPVLRTAPAPLFLLSSLVRKSGIKVVLTGEGSDEILGGYDIFKEAKIRRFWGRNLKSKFRPLLLKKLYPYMQNLQSQSDSYLRAFFRVSAEDLNNPFFSHLPRWELTARLKAFFSDEVKSALRNSDVYGEMRKRLDPDYFKWDAFSQAQHLETTGLLPGYILSSQGDRMAMAHSVEGRFPFLDHRVVKFAETLPPNLKMKVLNEKYILKKAFRELIPASVAKRPKQPYRAPDARSFYAGKIQNGREDYVDDLLSPDQIRKNGIFNCVAVQKLTEKAKAGQIIGVKDNMALVGILSTQLVVEQFINQSNRWRMHG